MVNLFRKFFSGYNVTRKHLNGRSYRFKYQSKPVFFDPVSMLGEFEQRAFLSSTRKLPLLLSEADLEKLLLKTSIIGQPSVVCEYEERKMRLEVSRFSFRDGMYPVSLYQFVENGELLGCFCRRYDYGAKLKSLIFLISGDESIHEAGRNESLLWNNEPSEYLLLEKFGHTQMWYFKDWEKAQVFLRR